MRQARAALEQAAPGVTVVGEVRTGGSYQPEAPLPDLAPPPTAAEVSEVFCGDLSYSQASPRYPDAATDALKALRPRVGAAEKGKSLWLRNWLDIGSRTPELPPDMPGSPFRQDPDNARFNAMDNTLREAAAVARLLVTERAAGVEHLQWAILQDYAKDTSGLFERDGSPKAAACAFATVCNLLAGAKFLRDESTAHVKRLVFQPPDGKLVTIVWRLGEEPAQLEIADAAAMEIVSVLGARRKAGEGPEKLSLPVGEEPLYLISGPAK